MPLDISLKLPSPILPLKHQLVESAGCQLYVKSEDQIHKEFGGNKWRKLKYNLETFRSNKHTELITFGGPFSNHIAAVASICKVYSVPCIGIIRGTYSDDSNPTLIKAKSEGMRLIHITKDAYRLKEESEEVREILDSLEHPLLVPEGGSNADALRGVAEIMDEIGIFPVSFDNIVVSAGTGMTAAGLISASKLEQFIIMNALNNVSLESSINSFLPVPKANWHINGDYTFGGFVKVRPELIEFINEMKETYDLSLDPLYNGKAFFGVIDLVRKGFFPRGSRILYINTGGGQGTTAYNYRTKKVGLKIKTQ